MIYNDVEHAVQAKEMEKVTKKAVGKAEKKLAKNIKKKPDLCPHCSDPRSILKRQDYQGSDLIKGGLNATDASDCCSKCLANKKCNFWTYGTSGVRKGVCWLKKDSIGRQVQSNRDAGKVCRSSKDCPPVADNGICQDCQKAENILRGHDYQGADLIKGGVTASSSSDCCSKCHANDQCLYWTYGKSGDSEGDMLAEEEPVGPAATSRTVMQGRCAAGCQPRDEGQKTRGSTCLRCPISCRLPCCPDMQVLHKLVGHPLGPGLPGL